MLTMANAGVITNSSEHFGISQDGMFVREYDGQINAGNSFRIINANDVTVFQIHKAFGGSATIETTVSTVDLTLSAGNDLRLFAQNGDIQLSTLPTSAPPGINRLYTQTAAQLGGSGSTRVVCIS